MRGWISISSLLIRPFDANRVDVYSPRPCGGVVAFVNIGPETRFLLSAGILLPFGARNKRVTRKILFLLAFALLPVGPARPDEAPAVRELRLEPSSTGVPLGHARLSVEPLVHPENGDGLSANYKVDVSPLHLGSEAGKLTIAVSDAGLRQLAEGRALEFSGQATSAEGSVSSVHGTATPSSGSGGAIKVRVEGKKGKLVFHTTYRLGR